MRGRTPVRDRATSPEYYSANALTRSQSPYGRFYHEISPARSASSVRGALSASHGETSQTPDTSYGTFTWPTIQPIGVDTTAPYQYSPLSDNEIRLLRVTPGSFDDHISCSLKIIPMEKLTIVLHEFQALSYAWGNDTPSYEVFLGDLPRSGDDLSTAVSTQLRPYPIRRNLYQALKHIRLTDRDVWLWVDASCIEQTNQLEKSQQIPKMPDIYSNAWNVIAWLGVDDSSQRDIEKAVDLVPDILNLNTLAIDLRGETPAEDILRSWVAFGNLLQRPWFKRRWVIQEVACARKLSVRVADKILSWLDFADAVDLYSDNIDRMRALYRQSPLFEIEPAALDNIDSSKAVALMRFSRSVFEKSPDSSIVSRLVDLESLVLAASAFAVSDVRDIVYALLYLANDTYHIPSTPSGSQPHSIFISDYSKHPAEIFEDFVRHSIATTASLDILCRPWASWPRRARVVPHKGKVLPTWIGVASFDEGGPYQRHVPTNNLLGPVGGQVYDASRGAATRARILPPTIDHVLQVDGIILGTVQTVSSSVVSNGILKNDWFSMLGWRGSLEGGIDDQLWRTLVANRNTHSKVAPTWYRRACALALTNVDDYGDLNITALIADASQPSTLINYLRRVQEATENRRIFRCTSHFSTYDCTEAWGKIGDAIVGLGPKHMACHLHQWACILYGASVPVVLNGIGSGNPSDGTYHVRLTGACYIHGHMEGEIFAGMSEEEIRSRSSTFSIH